MARVTRPGFDYTRLDVDFWNDIKVRRAKKSGRGSGRVEIRTSTLAPYVYMRLVTFILKENYYVQAESDIPFLLSEDLGLDEDTVSECIAILLDTGLLDAEMYREHGIYTSRGIQKQYNNLSDATKRKERIGETSPYSLLRADSPETKEKLREAEPQQESAHAPAPAIGPVGDDNDAEIDIVAEFFFERKFFKPQQQYRKLVNYNLTGGRNWNSMIKPQRIAAAAMWVQRNDSGETETRIRFDKSPEFYRVWKQVFLLARDKLQLEASLLCRFLDDGIEYRRAVQYEGDTVNALLCDDAVSAILLRHKAEFAPILAELHGQGRLKFFQMRQ